jgi:epoxide hydrolase-like predicted phosphatase
MKAIFFDASGVLYYRRNKYGAMQAFLERHHLPMPNLKEVRRATADARARASIGALSRTAYFDAVLAACGATAPALQAEGHQVLAAARHDFVLYNGVVEMVQTLRTRGFKLGIVTDTVTPTAETLHYLAEQGLDITWDAFANSTEVGTRKPDPRIYQAALTQSGVAPAETVFVGHNQAELDGAHALGMTTVAVLHKKATVRGDFILQRVTDLPTLPILQQADALRMRTRE